MIRTDNRETFNRLRDKYPVFTYRHFSYELQGNELNLNFVFELGNEIIFKPSVKIILTEIPQVRENNHELVKNIVFNIGLIELISYWKAACPPVIDIKTGSLTDKQVKWWKHLYYNGLGEYFYLNSLHVDKENFVEIKSSGPEYKPIYAPDLSDDYIVPVGGGKDSSVTLQLLKDAGFKVHPLIMNPRGATTNTVKAAQMPLSSILQIDRTIDPLLLKLNSDGYLNGHTPFSAMLAFYTLAVAAMSGIKNIALSNESSANEPTIPGTSINHQYSKSFEFETNFRDYYSNNISRSFNYFSFLRPLSELQIMAIFSKLDHYHSVFRSCNAGSKNNSWCGNCPKCLFTHIMLSAYRGKNYADQVIGTPMLDRDSNADTFDELTGLSAIKPFECVGTIEDVRVAMNMIIKATEAGNSLPFLARRFVEAGAYESTKIASQDLDLTQVQVEHHLEESLLQLVLKALKAS